MPFGLINQLKGKKGEAPVDYFTACLNLNHHGIIGYTGRPFADVSSMNVRLIENINNTVKEDDKLYILGNFIFGPLDIQKFLKTVKYFRSKIRCRRIFLIYGNHDRRLRREKEFIEQFEYSADYMETQMPTGHSIILFHYPIEKECWNRAGSGGIQLFGAYGNCAQEVNRFDVSVDSYAKLNHKKGPEGADVESYKPWSWGEICEQLKLN